MLDELDHYGTGVLPEPDTFVHFGFSVQLALYKTVHSQLGGHPLFDGDVFGFYGFVHFEHGDHRILEFICFGSGVLP